MNFFKECLNTFYEPNITFSKIKMLKLERRDEQIKTVEPAIYKNGLFTR